MSAAKCFAAYSEAARQRYERIGTMSRIGKKPVTAAQGRDRHGRRPDGLGQGAEGRAAVRWPTTTSRSTLDDGAIAVDAARRVQAGARRVGHARTMVANLVDGRDQASRGAGDQRRRLPRRGAGQDLKLSSATATTSTIRSRRASRSSTPKPTEIVDQRHRQAAGRPGRRGDPRWRQPEPYKGKGIKYADEYIFRKEGKKK